jgi:hypothetical protein
VLEHEPHQRGQAQATLACEVCGCDAVGIAKSWGVQQFKQFGQKRGGTAFALRGSLKNPYESKSYSCNFTANRLNLMALAPYPPSG